MFYTFLHQAPSYLQTAWFVGSSLTELVVIYSLRSRLFITQATPPPALLQWITVSCAAVCIALPLIPGVREWFGFAAIGMRSYVLIFVIVAAYFVVNELVKYFYYRYV